MGSISLPLLRTEIYLTGFDTNQILLSQLYLTGLIITSTTTN